MSQKPQVPVLDGWFSLDEKPHLLGSRCVKCGSYFFPKKISFCRNPACDSDVFEEVPLSRTGKIWSYTNACYQPPEPFIAADPYVPFSIAAVELEQEKMIVLGQVIEGVGVEQLAVGQAVELVLEPLFEDADSVKMTWKWKPAA